MSFSFCYLMEERHSFSFVLKSVIAVIAWVQPRIEVGHGLWHALSFDHMNKYLNLLT